MESFDQEITILNHSNEIAEKLLAVANGNRLKILCNLAHGPLSVGEIEENIKLSQSAVSQHLAKLKKSGIVSCKKDAQVHYYFLEDARIIDFINQLHKTFC